MSVTIKTWANRAAQVTYMTTQDLEPDEPLPVSSTMEFKNPTVIVATITALWSGDPLVAYGYRVSGPRCGSTDYTLDNNGDITGCANAAASQVDGILGKSATQTRKATVTIP